MTCYPDDLVFSEFEKKEKIGKNSDTLPYSVGFFLRSFNKFWPNIYRAQFGICCPDDIGVSEFENKIGKEREKM